MRARSLLAMLQTHRERQEAQQAAARQWAGSGLVFASVVGTPLEPSDVSRDFKKVLKKAGLPESLRFHDLRHACATLLIVMGVHPCVVMEILGHSQIGTTMNIYAHVLPRIQREAVVGLNALFADAPEGDRGTTAPPSAPPSPARDDLMGAGASPIP
ncbi:MAG TPA: tyrosine-type recombinase/integrase [Roseiflexaceae bacterium]|nr:tyrosine-type recombinase/integrase [Roseiflexaceae bacterium]HMP42043.1 tyrosine-type recombinase/integrase [Roseiflexaceae bacterium]